MSQREKLIERLKRVPEDFTWEELVRVFSAFGYEEHSPGGSHRRFMNPTTKASIIVPKPHHPNKAVKRVYLNKVIEHLNL